MSTYGSRGDVEPMVGLAVAVAALLVMATRFIPPAQAACCAMVASDLRSELMT